MRFDKQRRVRKRSEYQRIQASGCRVTTAHFVLLAAPRVPTSVTPQTTALSGSATVPNRLGITASRKVGVAVRRNRLKRLVRAAYQAYPEVVPEGFDLVVICRRFADLGRDEVIAEWKAASSKLKRHLERGPRGRTKSPRQSPAQPCQPPGGRT
jgi:ribonuclease P protein component